MKDRGEANQGQTKQLKEMQQLVAELTTWKNEHESLADELKQSELKFSKLSEKSVVGIYLIQDGLLKYVNPKFSHIFGYEVDEIISKLEVKAIIFPEDWPIVEENIRKRISGEVESIHFQFRGQKRNREVIHVEVYGSRINHSGRPAVIGTMVDITDRIRAQRSLDQQLKIFQGLYDLALAMIAERSLDENLAIIVDKSRQLLGTDTAFIGLHDEKTDELWLHISSGLKTEAFKKLRVPLGHGLMGKVAQTGKMIVVKDYFKQIGPEFHEVVRAEGLISGIAVPVQIGQTNFGVLLTFNRTKTVFSKIELDTLSLFGNFAAVEITRKRAQERLQDSEEKYRSLYAESKRREELYRSFLNSSVDAILIFDLKEKAQFVSPSFTQIFGWTLKEFNNDDTKFLPDSERESNIKLFKRILEKGITVSGFETKRNAKDGSTMDVSISASRYHDHRGDPAGISVIIRDITSFKSIERARRRAVHHLSHELVTPLSVIETSLRKLSKNNLSDSSKGKSINRIKRNLDRLKDVQAIVQEMVSPPKYEPQELQVDLAVNEILDDLRKNYLHRSVTVISRLEPIEADIIDPKMLGRVLQTLVKNAVENSPDEARVIVSLSKMSSGILLRVEDRGIGIHARDREFIFKAFHHTQETDLYSTKKPFDFNAGGKGLELMHLNTLGEQGAFDISFESSRCRYITKNSDQCCGKISLCEHINDLEGCKQSGGTIFSVLFKKISE